MADAGGRARWMALAENRLLAWAVFAIVAASSILLSGSSRLKSERSIVMDIYCAPQGIYADLSARAEAAYNLCEAAKIYPVIDDTLINSILDARGSMLEAMKDREACADHSSADVRLNDAVALLYGELSAAGLNDSDIAFARKQHAEFIGRGLTISRSDYNASAESFNKIINRFPASLIGMICGVKRLDLF
jgi:hypothetical protein